MKTRRETRNGTDACPAPEELVALAVSQEPDAGGEAARRHAQACPQCGELFRDARKTVAALRRSDAATVVRDLLPGVLERIPAKRWRASPPRVLRFNRVSPARRFVRFAAALLLLLGVALAAVWLQGGSRRPAAGPGADGDVRFHKERVPPAADRGLAWLLARQAPSGGWDVKKLGGRPEYAPALNGLAALALARTGGPEPAPAVADALDRAAAFLARGQSADGRFGGEFDGTMYNQGIAALALIEACGATRNDGLREPIAAALEFVARRQAPSGGWGYHGATDAQPNTSVTAWQVQALLAAARSGLRQDQRALRRGLAWMSGTVNGKGFFGYERAQHFPDGPNTLTMMGAYCLLSARNTDAHADAALVARVERGMEALAAEGPTDYYGSFFYASAMSEADTGAFRDALDRVRLSVIVRQRAAGGDEGVWLADDRWGGAGGQIYSTSMALLALAAREP